MKYTIQDDKIFMKYYVEVSDLKPKDKITLFEFIDKASQEQLIYLATTGKMSANPVMEADFFVGVGEQVLTSIAHAMQALGIPEGTVIKVLGSSNDPLTAIFNLLNPARLKTVGLISTGVLAAFILFVSYKFYKRYISKSGRACKDFAGKAKKDCIKRFKMEGIKAQLGQLEKGTKLCDKSKDPSKCKAKITKKMAKVKLKLGR